MNALAQGLSSELQGTQQQLSGQQMAGQTLGTALTGATNLQAQQISGLGILAGLAAPVQAPYSSALYNPMTGGMVTQGGLGGMRGITQQNRRWR